MSAQLWNGFLQIVGSLTPHGVPRPSDAWMREVRRFYTHPTAKVWLSMCGRGAGKNLVGILCDLTEVLCGDFTIPPGEIHYQVQVSENRQEAEKTLRQMAQYLTLLGVPHTSTADTIQLGGELANRGVKVLASRIGAVSGFRSTGFTAQEIAKWNNEGTNPAAEISASANAQTITHRQARKRYFSTPMGTQGFFPERAAMGDTDAQIVTRGASWLFNPTITEADTRALEPHEPTWRREYLGIPSEGANGVFSAEDIDAAIRPITDLRYLCSRPIQLLDSSAGSGDAWTWGLAGWCIPANVDPADQYLWEDIVEGEGKPGLICDHHGKPMRQSLDARGQLIPDPKWVEKMRPVVCLHGMGSIEGAFRASMTADDAVRLATDAAKRGGAIRSAGDGYQDFFLQSAMRKRGIRYDTLTWSQPSKQAAVAILRRWLRDRLLVIEPGEEAEKLRNEMLSFVERITNTGVLTYGARRSTHDDRVALLLNLAMAEEAYMLEGSPNGRSNRRFEIHDYNDDGSDDE